VGSTIRPVVPFAAMTLGEDPVPLVPRTKPTFLPEPEPRTLWCPVISVDDHVVEPPDLFERRVPRSRVDDAPVLVDDEQGIPFWIVDGLAYPFATSNGSAGRPVAEWVHMPQRYEDFRRGVYDTRARLGDMDVNGVWASLCFPSFVWGFAGRRFSSMRDGRVGLACLRAYNDWMLDEWCASSPDRFVPCQVPWLADPSLAAEEICANAQRGFRAVTFPETPNRLGFPSVYSDAWDPFFRACEETETVINLHVGASGSVARPSGDSPTDVAVTLFPVNGVMAAVDWVYARIPIRFPNIRIVMSEAGVSWVPMVLERLTRSYRFVDASDAWSSDDPHPNELLLRNFWFASIEDPSAFRMLDVIGDDKVMIESDYPHADSTWPDTQPLIAAELGHLDPAVIRKIAYGNASALYRHPPPPAPWMARSMIGSPEADG
jgi:predicted TIM-barrel fold metal-dependent hydrolase